MAGVKKTRLRRRQGELTKNLHNDLEFEPNEQSNSDLTVKTEITFDSYFSSISEES